MYIDDKAIINGLVTPQQKIELELKLIAEFMTLAQNQGQNIEIISDEKEYNKRLSGTQEGFYFFRNEEKTDLRSVALRMLNTPLGLTYSKLLISEHHQS